MRIIQAHTTLIALLLAFCLPAELRADSSILVLDFGLHDDTLLPDVPEEVARVESLAPWVRRYLRGLGNEVPEVPADPELTQQAANGYLLAHPRRAIELGRAAGVRWVAIGYSNKFSFLISWVRVHLIDTVSGKAVARAEADLRGSMTDQRMTERTAQNLAEQIHELVRTVERQREERGS